ncbi:MAG: Ig-like domain-containing protein [Pseudomonadota bacterium]
MSGSINIPRFLALEPRLLLDGAMVETLVETGADPANEPPVAVASELDASLGLESPQRIAFIDAAIADREALAAALTADPNRDVVLLGATAGLDFIARYLEGRQGIDAIEIYSHGSAGELHLGGERINAGAIDHDHRGTLAKIGGALAAQGDIILLGCDVAHGAVGERFISRFAALTGADIAASTDLTGLESLGGDWELEHHHGEVSVALDVARLDGAVTGVLSAAPVVDLDADNSAGLSGNDTVTTFHAHGSAVALTESDVDITDADDTEMASMQISVANVQNGVNEILTFNGDAASSVSVDLDGVSLNNTIVVNGVTFDIDFDGTTFTITNDAGGNSPIVNFESLLAAITYQNTDQAPTSGVRTFAIGVTDASGDGSVAANAEVIVSSGGTPDVSLNGVFAYEGIYATWFFNDPSDPFRGDSTSGMVSNMADVKAGSGLNITDEFTRLVITDVQSTSFADAVAANEYIELEFTTAAGDALLLFEGLIRRVGSNEIPDVASEYPYQLAMQVSNDAQFDDAVTIFDDTTMSDPGDSVTDNVDWGDLDWVTQPGQTYYFRFYFYNVATGEAAIDDIGFQGLSVTRDWARTFNEGDPPVLLGAGDGYVNDFTEGDITQVQIVGAGLAEPASEDLKIGGQTFALGTDVVVPVTVTAGLSTLDVTYDATSATFTIVKQGGGVMPDTDLTALVNSLFYENRKVVPTAGDRTFTITVSDGTYTSPGAVSTITVVPDPTPSLDLDADDSEGTLGADFANTFTEGGGEVAVAHTDTDITDADSTEIASATITVGGLQDGADEQLVFNGDAGTSTTVSLNAASSNTVFVTGNVFDLVYDGSQFTVSLNGGGNMELTDVEKMISNMTYLNGSSNPTEGARTFDFVVVDPSSNSSNTARSTITVDNLNDPPTADNEAIDADEDSILLVLNGSADDILVGDNDPDGDTLTIDRINGSAYTLSSSLTLPSGALLTVNGNGSYVYNPNGQFEDLSNGDTTTDSFTYRINDGNGETATATVTITIQGADDPPASTDNAVTTLEDTDYTFVLGDFPYSDAESDPMTAVRIDTFPTDGKLFFNGSEVTGVTTILVADINAGRLVFRPDPDENGTGYATFDFSVGDITAFSPTATMTVHVTPQNDPPTADNESATVSEDTPFFGVNNSADDILVGDDDPDGDALTIFEINGAPYTPGTALTLPSGAQLTVNSNGSYIYNPNGQFESLDDGETDTDSFTYSIRDPSGEDATATVTLTINGANDPPTTADNAVTTPEDTDYEFQVSDFTFNDADGDTLSDIRINTLPTDGKLFFNGSEVTGVTTVPLANLTAGDLVFRPDPDENGTSYATFGFSVGDGTDFSPSATMTVNVTPDAEPPVADDDSAPYAGAAVTIDVADGDVDPDDGLDLNSVVITSNPPGSTLAPDGKTLTVPTVGVWSVNPGGTMTFTPEVGYTGIPDPITYTIDNTPGTETSNAATVTLTDTVAPVVVDDTEPFTGTPVTVDVTDNDNTTGPVSPNTVRITSNPPGTTLAPDGKTLTVPGEGVWTVNATNGDITFTPEANFTDQPTAITYEADDASGNTSNEATVTLTDAAGPTADDDNGVFVGSPIEVDVVVNDDGEPIDPTSVVITSNPGGTTLAPDGKTLTVPGEGVWSVNATTGAITFTPEAGFTGPPAAITYTVDDADGNTSNTATVTLTVGLTPVTDDDSGIFAGSPVTVDVLANDTAGDPPVPTTVQIRSVPPGATLEPDGKRLDVPGEGVWTVDPIDGDITFTPEAGFTEAPTPITYTVESATATVSAPAAVTLTDQTPPIAEDDSANAPPGAVTVDVVANDQPEPVEPTTVEITSNPPGSTLAVDGKTLTVPSEGTWTVNATSGAITFTPNGGFTDDPTPIVYQVEDAAGNADTATVTINYGPIATDDSPPNLAPGPVTINPATNDVTGDTVVPATLRLLHPTTNDPVTSVTVSGEGTWSVDTGTGAVTFTPAASFFGDPSPIDYRIADAAGDTDTATINLDYAPVARDDTGSFDGTPTTINPLTNDVDPDPTSVQLDDGSGGLTSTRNVPGEGVWTVDPGTGNITFTPDPSFTGDPSPIIYSVADPDGNRDTATVTLGAAPQASDDLVTDATLGPVSVDVTQNDVGGDPVDPTTVRLLSPSGSPVTSLSVPGEGTWQVNPTTGVVTFTPVDGLSEQPTPVRYQVADDDGEVVSAMINIEFILADDTAPEVLLDAIAPPTFAPAPPSDAYRPFQLGYPPRFADGAVVDAVQALSDLNGMPDLGARGAVVAAVNGVEGLGGTVSPIGADGHVLRVVKSIEDRTLADANERASQSGFGRWAPNDLRGYSLRFDVNPSLDQQSDRGIGDDGTGDQGTANPSVSASSRAQLAIESVLHDQRLYLELKYEVGSESSERDRLFGASGANGEPLPEWIKIDPEQGLILAEIPVGTERFELKVWVILEGGTVVERRIFIDATSGQISSPSTIPSFSDQVNAALGESERRVDALRQSLG